MIKGLMHETIGHKIMFTIKINNLPNINYFNYLGDL